MTRFLRRPDVEKIVGITTSTLYEYMAKGNFPKPVKLSTNRVAWVENEIEAWLAQKIAERDEKEAA